VNPDRFSAVGAQIVFRAGYDVPSTLLPGVYRDLFVVLVQICVFVMAVGGEIVFGPGGTLEIQDVILGDRVPTHDSVYVLMGGPGGFHRLVACKQALLALIQVDEPPVRPGGFEHV
jgi:hypothetical protein